MFTYFKPKRNTHYFISQPIIRMMSMGNSDPSSFVFWYLICCLQILFALKNVFLISIKNMSYNNNNNCMSYISKILSKKLNIQIIHRVSHEDLINLKW